MDSLIKNHLKFVEFIAELQWEIENPFWYNSSVFAKIEMLLEKFDCVDDKKDYYYFYCLIKEAIHLLHFNEYPVLDDFPQKGDVGKPLRTQTLFMKQSMEFDGLYHLTVASCRPSAAFSNLSSTQYRVFNLATARMIYGFLAPETNVVEIGVDGWALLLTQNHLVDCESKVFYYHVLTKAMVHLPNLPLVVLNSVHGCHSPDSSILSSVTMIVYHWRVNTIMIFRHFPNNRFWINSCVELSFDICNDVRGRLLLDNRYLWICDGGIICLSQWKEKPTVSRLDLPLHVWENVMYLASTTDNVGLFLTLDPFGKFQVFELCFTDVVAIHKGLSVLTDRLELFHDEKTQQTLALIRQGLTLLKSGFELCVTWVKRLDEYAFFLSQDGVGYARKVNPPFQPGHVYLAGYTEDILRFMLEEEKEEEEEILFEAILRCPFINNHQCSCKTGWFFQ